MAQANDAAKPPPAPAGFSIAELPTNLFAIVMATGIVSLAAWRSGWLSLAWTLLVLNVLFYVLLWILTVTRAWMWRERMLADFFSHAKAPGYFTLVAGTCVLGNQFVVMASLPQAGLALWLIGLVLWCLLTYTMLPALMSVDPKPPMERALSGTWLLAVVATQAISVLGALLAPLLDVCWEQQLLFAALGFWLVGSMLYIWLISLILYRIVFLPLLPSELSPPYWVNMGAMAISTLAGASIIHEVAALPLLTELVPFLKGLTLLFWATATWWIPMLLSLGLWRHVWRRIPLAYEHGYWAAVFPLGMYAVCTQRLIDVLQLQFLRPIFVAFAWISVAAWLTTFAGLLAALWNRLADAADRTGHRHS